jgi:hypothetical protein
MKRSKLLRVFNDKGEFEESLYIEATKVSSFEYSLHMINEVMRAAYANAALDKLIPDTYFTGSSKKPKKSSSKKK